MGDHIHRAAEAKRLGATRDEETTKTEVTDYGHVVVDDSYAYFRAITPAGTDFTDGPCDALFCTAAATVTLTPSDNPDTDALPLPLLAGFSKIRTKKITVISTGTVYGCWHRRPPED